MASHNQLNLQKRNAEYVSNFDQGHLALPPAKKYAVGKYHVVSAWLRRSSPDMRLWQSPAWTPESTQQQPMVLTLETLM